MSDLKPEFQEYALPEMAQLTVSLSIVYQGTRIAGPCHTSSQVVLTFPVGLESKFIDPSKTVLGTIQALADGFNSKVNRQVGEEEKKRKEAKERAQLNLFDPFRVKITVGNETQEITYWKKDGLYYGHFMQQTNNIFSAEGYTELMDAMKAHWENLPENEREEEPDQEEPGLDEFPEIEEWPDGEELVSDEPAADEEE